ncbi:MAG: dihydropteroate synthase [Pyrinomonadaceae bacterium]
MMEIIWQFGKRRYLLGRETLILGIVNVTPDSFSDGGQHNLPDAAFDHAAKLVREGAHILDIGGESTRPGGDAVPVQEELDRVIPVIERLAREFDVPISIDTTKTTVARAAIAAGAEIINDISGLRFEPELADLAAATQAGLILMHSLGDPNSLHHQPAVYDIFETILSGLEAAVADAVRRGVDRDAIVLDPGIGFGKTFEQNVALIADFGSLVGGIYDRPWLVGTSRKSFVGRLLNGAPVDQRLYGSLATATSAVIDGAHIVRVHDVAETVQTLRVIDALRASADPPD